MEDEDWEIPPPPRPVTLVVVGRTGNGKSATGNSILGTRVFKSKLCSSAVTETSQLHSATLSDGRSVQVVDTPGLFDPNTPIDFIGEEIVKCIELAKEGVHAVLLVLSTRNRFTAEELAATEGLQALFGPKIVDYTIVVFTGGDELDENDEDLDSYLRDNAPSALLDLLKACKGRQVLFDNKTMDPYKKRTQVSLLLNLVEQVLDDNGGQPYSNDLFEEAKKRATEHIQREKLSTLPGILTDDITKLKEEMEKSHQEQLRLVISLLEEKLRIHSEQLQNHLDQERRAREAVEQYAREAKEKAEDDIKKLRIELEKANREREELHKKYGGQSSKPAACNIL